MINNKKIGSTREETRQAMQTIGDAIPMKDKLVGGASGLEFIGGVGVKAAKGAFSVIKSLLTRRNKKIIPGGGGTYGKPNPSNLKGTGSSRGGKINEIIGPLGKGLNKSKPVNVTGPNPAYKTGAGGNSYPR